MHHNLKTSGLDLVHQLIRIQNSVYLSTKHLTPINFHKEKETFFSSKRYNPQFTYQPVSVNVSSDEFERLHKIIEKSKFPRTIIAYLHRVLFSHERMYQAKRAIGSDNFSPYAHYAYSYNFSTKARQLDTLEPKVYADTQNSPLFNAREIRKIFSTYIETHPYLSDISILLDSFNDHTIRVGRTKIIIGDAIVRNKANVNRLIVHEIESHILQKYNLHIQSNPLAFIRTHPERELYAEGMAVYNEVKTNTITKSAYNMYRFRYQAVMMQGKSFREIYTYLADNKIKPTLAYTIAYRVKRGMSDTSKPGGFPKDAAYLLGYKTVKEYLASGGRVQFLYLSQVPEIGELLLKHNLLPVSQINLPTFYKQSLR